MLKWPFVRESAAAVYEKCGHVAGREVDGQLVLIDEREMELFHLNEVGQAIWNKIDGRCDSGEIVRHILQSFEGPETRIKKDAEDFFRQLLKRELIREKNA